MRVVQVLPELNEGGVERGTVELSRELVKRGIESVIISKGGKLVEQVHREGGRHVAIDACSKNPLTALSRTKALKRALNEINPDVIHARSRVPAWLCRLGNRGQHRRPFVTTVHGLNRINRYSRVMVSGDRVIAVGEPVREHVCKGYGLSTDRVTVIDRGVDMHAFDPQHADQGFIRQFKAEHGLDGKFVVTSVGRVTWLKDYESFITAIAKLAPNSPKLVGLIVGGVHPDKRAYCDGLKKQAKDLGVADRVVFAGSQSNIAEIYALSDLMVNASLKMGNVGRTVIEALAMDVPVIATTWPGLANLVEDGVNGAVIETKNPDALAAAIKTLHANPPGNVRQTVPYAYTLDAMVEKVIGVYEDLLKSSALSEHEA
ncbi:MAG: glycosyltransferase family 4 protein [Phycisphaeraceae bacterium]|nr:glycosyltransferase family 4 protein [Phycisphaeraceae bacterium]